MRKNPPWARSPSGLLGKREHHPHAVSSLHCSSGLTGQASVVGGCREERRFGLSPTLSSRGVTALHPHGNPEASASQRRDPVRQHAQCRSATTSSSHRGGARISRAAVISVDAGMLQRGRRSSVGGNKPELGDCSFRTIWAAPQPRAAPPLWSESGGRCGVSDLGSREQPIEEAPRRRWGRPRPGTRNVALAVGGPAMPDGTKRFNDSLGVTLERVSGVPSAQPGDVPRSG
jgi:hypothetical protein